jgi:hypothetical protein
MRKNDESGGYHPKPDEGTVNTAWASKSAELQEKGHDKPEKSEALTGHNGVLNREKKRGHADVAERSVNKGVKVRAVWSLVDGATVDPLLRDDNHSRFCMVDVERGRIVNIGRTQPNENKGNV